MAMTCTTRVSSHIWSSSLAAKVLVRGVGKLIIYHRRGGGLLVHSSVGKPFLAVGWLRITGLVHILLLGLAPGILILFVGSST
jgi:hypothetical protein